MERGLSLASRDAFLGKVLFLLLRNYPRFSRFTLLLFEITVKYSRTLRKAIFEDSNSKSLRMSMEKYSSLRGCFFCFSLTRGRVCGRKQKNRQENTLNTRGCSFWVPLNTRGALHARHTTKTHTEHERVQF